MASELALIWVQEYHMFTPPLGSDSVMFIALSRVEVEDEKQIASLKNKNFIPFMSEIHILMTAWKPMESVLQLIEGFIKVK